MKELSDLEQCLPKENDEAAIPPAARPKTKEGAAGAAAPNKAGALLALIVNPDEASTGTGIAGAVTDFPAALAAADNAPHATHASFPAGI